MSTRSISIDAAEKKAAELLGKLPHLNEQMEIKVVKDQNTIFLSNPWNDKSVAFIIYKDGKLNRDIFSILKNIYLPPALSALYHKNENKLEVVWTAYKLPSYSDEIIGRYFEFCFKENIYKCHFSESSDSLKKIASHAAYLQVSETAFRNLQSFSQYSKAGGNGASSRFGLPTSFYIENLEEDQDGWVDIIKHVNFYLRYFDNKSPHIVLHEARGAKLPTKVRYINGEFPNKIVSRELNANLLSLWLAAYDHDITTKFLLYYRILEYVSSLYLQSKQRHALLKILHSPSALALIDKTLDDVASIVREDNTSEIDRYIKMFEDLVSPEKIWAEIEFNSEAFTSDVKFDGGLEIKPIVANTKSIDSLGAKGMQSIARALRQIRHGLAHGGEAQAGKIILPTRENFERLIPWVHLAMVAAGEVVIYEHLG
ncbi:hypothetical protein [Sphingobium chungangianum]